MQLVGCFATHGQECSRRPIKSPRRGFERRRPSPQLLCRITFTFSQRDRSKTSNAERHRVFYCLHRDMDICRRSISSAAVLDFIAKSCSNYVILGERICSN
jgi:hypothetical protein